MPRLFIKFTTSNRSYSGAWFTLANTCGVQDLGFPKVFPFRSLLIRPRITETH